MLIQGKLLSFGVDLTEAAYIKRKVFIEEQGFAENLVFDEQEQFAVHALVYQGLNQINAVATGRIVFDGDTCTMNYIAVLNEYRGNHYGDFAVRLLLNKAFNVEIEKIIVNSPLTCIGFYEKIGFVQEGGEFIEAGVSQVKMSICSKGVLTECNKVKKI